MAEGATAATGVSELVERGKPYEALADWGKRIFATLVIVGSACFAAYKHFATAAEVADIRCQLVIQSRINKAVSEGSRNIRTALGVLKGQMLAPATNDGQKKTVESSLAEAIVGIDKALQQVEDVKAGIIDASAAGGTRKCAV